MNIIGIDPGISGGIAVIYDGGEATAFAMPDTDTGVLDILRDVTRTVGWTVGWCVVYIEKVNPQPKNGARGNFTFGRSVGALRMAVAACGIPMHDVTPQRWQASFGLPSATKAGSNTAKKNAHKRKAQEMFPGIRMTHAIADALLIAEWGRRQP